MNARPIMKKKIIILVLILAVGCGVYLVYRHLASQHIRNVLLISMDTTRSDYLSCYGFPRKTTPNIDKLTKEGVLFENSFSKKIERTM